MIKKQWDERREIIIPGDQAETTAFAAQHWIRTAEDAIRRRGRFCVALSGGTTPKAIYQSFQPGDLDWDNIWIFWSDERAVPPDSPESNYRMAMDAGFSTLPVPHSQIFRMHAENNLKAHARAYEKTILSEAGPPLFDLVMLGVGEDGHTASLFPGAAPDPENALVAAHFLPEKESWRMTLTFRCINQSRLAVVYALGSAKETIIPKVLQTSSYPASHIGTEAHPALWILDTQAAKLLIKNFV